MNVRGFTMIEILVALLVLAVAVTAALALALGGFAATTEARRAEVAAGLAADLAGRVRVLPGVDWAALPEPFECGADCTPEQLGALEFAAWQADVAAALPTGAGSLWRTGADGLALTLAWTETGGTRRELQLGIAP